MLLNAKYIRTHFGPRHIKVRIPCSRTRVSGRRYYSPGQGRFLGRDPKGEAGGLNLYGFVANNPVNRWDYLGMVTMMPAFSAGYRQDVETLPNDCTVTTIFAPDDMAGGDGAEYIYDQWSTCPSGVDPSDPAPAPIIAGGGGVFGQIAGGDNVAPNNTEHPDCAGLRQQAANARSTRDKHVRHFQNGGQYALAASRNLSAQDIISMAGIGASASAAARHQYLRGLPTQSVQQLGLGAERYSNATYRARVAGRVAGSVGGVFVAVDVVAFGDALADGRGEDALFAGGNVAYGTAALFVTGPVGWTIVGTQLGVNTFMLGAKAYYDSVDAANLQRSIDSSLQTIQKADSISNRAAERMSELGCK